jgi:hypothetical protein
MAWAAKAVFKLSNTWRNPAGGGQSGFPAPGSGGQTTGAPLVPRHEGAVEWTPEEPTKGRRTFLGARAPTRGVTGQQGFPPVEDAAQARPPGSMPNVPPIHGEAIMVWTPYYDRGAAAYVPNYGKLLVNPIGAGIVALSRPQATYGRAAQYLNGALWWTSQDIPTSVNLQGLTDPYALAAILDDIEIEAVVRTTG